MPHKILLCDDEAHILRASEFKFERAGFDVRCAADGEEAWESIAADLPDIVVTDLQMPRLDGLGLARRIKDDPRTNHIPIIMLTARGFDLSPEELNNQYGIRVLLSKPFSPRELLRLVDQIIPGNIPAEPQPQA
jgi:CheY-like chemotaxis protein